MKILKNNNEKPTQTNEFYPRKFVCEQCKSELEYEKEDVKVGTYGCAFVSCPCCGYDNFLDDVDCVTLTSENIEFPMHFHHTSISNGAIDNCNTEEIRRHIQEAIDFFRRNKDDYAWEYQCGTLHISVYRYSGDENYEVIVTNDFYSTFIPFESEDYELI